MAERDVRKCAKICDGCGRMLYDVARVALFVGGVSKTERDLCRACASTITLPKR